MSTRHPINKAGRTRQALHLLVAICLLPLPLCAADTYPAELERLFFTPSQRADMQTARTRPALSPSQPGSPDVPSAVVKFDGVLIRSDGKTTRWVDGKAQTGTTGISNMKPGQVRANGKLYEPYQVRRPLPPASSEKDPTP